MGSDGIGLPVLEVLLREWGGDFKLAGVVSNCDKKSGRGQKLQANVVSQFANAHGIPLQTPVKPDGTTVKWIRELGADLIVVMAYGHILKRDLFACTPLKTVNLHASILPKYRGCAPITEVILNGEAETGVSLMGIVEAMDAGPVLDVERIAIDRQETSGTLREKLALAAAIVLKRNLHRMLFESEKLVWQEQDHARATYTKKICKENGRIDFSLPAATIERQVRAFDPWPGSFFYHGETPIKVWQPVVVEENNRRGNFTEATAKIPPGTILPHIRKDLLAIATTDGTIGFQSLQKPGGKRLMADVFMRGMIHKRHNFT